MDRNLALEVVRVTEMAAIASARLMGTGNKNESDQAAVDAMRKAFDSLNIDGTVVIGEGERDEAPMLYIGERVGKNNGTNPAIDIALDPLEGTNLCAFGRPGATQVEIETARIRCHGHLRVFASNQPLQAASRCCACAEAAWLA